MGLGELRGKLKREGDICTLIASSNCCTVETNTNL